MFYNFPNNYIPFEIGWKDGIDFKKESEAFKKVLDSSRNEHDVQKYIKDNKKWFIPASILKDYDFGHHSAYLVPEQSLGSEYRTDYMLVGKNSIGFHVILVEFENANVDYLLKSKNNQETESVRNGLSQIRDWKLWMDKDTHREYFIDSSGLSAVKKDIPSWGIHYCLVVSRRDRMDDNANSKRRYIMHEISGLNIITYDRLVDNIRSVGLGVSGI